MMIGLAKIFSRLTAIARGPLHDLVYIERELLLRWSPGFEKLAMKMAPRSIFDFERHLHANGTRIVKFFLHLSKEEQCKRFLARIDEPDKNWKFSAGDVEERKFWKDYMHAYQEALAATSTKQAPWYVVPADDKQNARLIVSQIVLETLDGLNMCYPPTGPERKRELQAIRKRLRSTRIRPANRSPYSPAPRPASRRSCARQAVDSLVR